MRLKSLIPVFVSLALSLGTAHAAPSVTCGTDDGRERLTTEGFSVTFEAPAAFAPELATTHQETGNLVSHHRTARFPFVVDLAPFERATVAGSITWDLPSDYDLYVLTDDGDVLGQADNMIGQGQEPTEERFEGGLLEHCQQIQVIMRNWAGIPGQPVTLNLDLVGLEPLLACAEADPAPGCAGKAAGEAPDLVPDTRDRFFLAGDAGQAAMVGAYQQTLSEEKWPFRGVLSDARPTGGVPNQHTRALLGFRGQQRNPFFAHFDLALDAPTQIAGAPTLLVWVSAPAGDATTRLIADLWADDYVIATAEVVGGPLVDARDPRPVLLTFPELDWTVYETLTLQIGMNAVATSEGAVGNPADAQMSLWYGSVQYQSRLTLG